MSKFSGLDIEQLKKVATMHRIMTDDLVGLNPYDAARSLRARLNRVVYSRGEKWMLPRWMIRGLEERTISLLEKTALENPYIDELIYIGTPGGRYVAIADSSGLTSPGTGCGSVDIWILKDKTLYFPAMILDKDVYLAPNGSDDQVFSISMYVGSVKFTRLVYHAVVDGIELVYNQISLRNNSFEPVTFTFFVAIRPMSHEGVEPINSLEYDQATGTVYSNHRLVLETDKQPASVIMTTADNANLPIEVTTSIGRCDTSFSTPKGLGTAVLRFDIRLGPASTQELFFVTPLEAISRDSHTRAFPKSSQCLDKTVEAWFRFDQSTVRGVFSDPRLNHMMSQLKALLAKRAMNSLLGDKLTVPAPIEKARVVSTLNRLGATDLVQQLIRMLLPQLTEWRPSDTVLAPLVWSVLQSCEYSSDASYLHNMLDIIKRWAALMSSFLSTQYTHSATSPPAGTLASGEPTPVLSSVGTAPVSAVPKGTETEESWVQQLREELAHIENMGRVEISQPLQVPTMMPPAEYPPRSFTPREFAGLIWTYAVARSLVSVISSIDEIETFRDLPRMAFDLHSRIMSASAGVLGSEFEISMSETEGQFDALYLLSTLTLIGLQLPGDTLSRLIQAIRSSLLRGGMLRVPGESRYVSGYLTLRLAQAYVMLRDSDSTELLLVKMLGYSTRLGLLPEMFDPNNPSRGSGDCGSLIAASDLLLLIIGMLSRYEDMTLIALPCVPDEWFTSETPISLSNIPCRTGQIAIEIATSTNQHQIELRMEHLPQEIVVNLPSHRSVSMVRVYGGNVVSRVQDDVSPHIRLVPLANTVVCTFRK